MEVSGPLFSQGVDVMGIDPYKYKSVCLLFAWILPFVGSDDAIVGMLGFDYVAFVSCIRLKRSLCFKRFFTVEVFLK